MIAARDCLQTFREKHKDLTVISMCDYDTKYYIITAVKDPNIADYNDPYYAIRKSDGTECSFSPMDDLDKFLDAASTRSVPI